MDPSQLKTIMVLVSFIPAIICHEVAHGYVAYKLGDPTAKALGRLTLNPLKHIDPFGTVMLPILLALLGAPVFGYAKPVPYNPQNFVKNLEGPVSHKRAVRALKRGELLVGLAGPATNLLLALFAAALFRVLTLVGNFENPIVASAALFLTSFGLVNIALMFFNLLPIPPLDGSSIIAVFLPPKALQGYYQIQRYSMFVLLAFFVVLPSIIGFNPISWYFNHTLMPLLTLLFG